MSLLVADIRITIDPVDLRFIFLATNIVNHVDNLSNFITLGNLEMFKSLRLMAFQRVIDAHEHFQTVLKHPIVPEIGHSSTVHNGSYNVGHCFPGHIIVEFDQILHLQKGLFQIALAERIIFLEAHGPEFPAFDHNCMEDTERK